MQHAQNRNERHEKSKYTPRRQLESQSPQRDRMDYRYSSDRDSDRDEDQAGRWDHSRFQGDYSMRNNRGEGRSFDDQPSQHQDREYSRDQSYGSWRTEPSSQNAGEDRRSFTGRGPKGYKRSDERIEDEVNDALTQDSATDASDIQVSVSDGEVTLKGTVENRNMKRSAEDCIESLSGVTQVHNQLRVKSPQHSEKQAYSANSNGASSSKGEAARGDMKSDSQKTNESPRRSLS